MKTAVIYWSGTGNTEAMAKAVAEGAGAECFAVSERRSLRTVSSSHFSQA